MSDKTQRIIESISCPITKQIFCKPVVANDGVTYEESSLKEWLKTSRQLPVTKKNYCHHAENLFMKNTIDDFLNDHPEYKDEQFKAPYDVSKYTSTSSVLKLEFDEFMKIINQQNIDFNDKNTNKFCDLIIKYKNFRFTHELFLKNKELIGDIKDEGKRTAHDILSPIVGGKFNKEKLKDHLTSAVKYLDEVGINLNNMSSQLMSYVFKYPVSEIKKFMELFETTRIFKGGYKPMSLNHRKTPLIYDVFSDYTKHGELLKKLEYVFSKKELMTGVKKTYLIDKVIVVGNSFGFFEDEKLRLISCILKE